MVGTLRFQTDDDLLEYEPNIEQIWPRVDEDGNARNRWDVQHKLAMQEIERFFLSRKDTAERFEIGRVGLRDQANLKAPAACLSLHYIYVAADTQGDAEGYFARKASHYWQRAMAMLDAISLRMDYDTDGGGAVEVNELDQPFVPRVIRG